MQLGSKPLALADAEFHRNKFEVYAQLREERPVAHAKIAGMRLQLVSRYEDCLSLVKDERFIRSRSRARGKGSDMPFPLPKHMKALVQSMIIMDDPEHRRLRQLVQKAFAPKSIQRLTDSTQQFATQLMDKLEADGGGDLQSSYALQIPSHVIAQLMGIGDREVEKFQNSIRILSEGLNGWSIARTMLFDLPKVQNFVREMIQHKRAQPGDDLLSELIVAEQDGDRLSEDELVAMVFLLIVAGFETTVHLITNAALALFTHPEQLQRLRDEPELMGSAVEESLRFCGPVHGTKMNYAREDVEWHGELIKRGTPVVPILGSANRDGSEFRDPDRFDIARTPNKHLSFSQGNHFCLGAFLARMEAKIALSVFVERSHRLQLAVPQHELTVQTLPLWHRYTSLPVSVA